MTSHATTPERRIKVMLVIDGLGLGGAEMVLRDLVNNLNAERFDVCVCCTKGIGGSIGEELRQNGVRVVVLPGQSDDRVDYLTAPKLRRVIKDEQIDIIHTHAAPALFDAAPCRLTMRGVKLIHTFHYGNYPFDSRRHHWLEYICSRAADRLIAVGIEQGRRIQTTYRLPESRIGTIWNGVTVSAPIDEDSFRARFGTGDRLLVGTIAKLIHQKGLDYLLDVAQHCRDAGLPMQFVVVGEGPLRSELEERRGELGLDDVVILAGWIDSAAERVLPEFDVFFQPSRWEAMSIAILEAMATSKPIVATKVGDNHHVLKDDLTGILVDSGDVSGMTHALERLVDSDLRKRLGDAAKESFEREFTLRHMVRNYEEEYLSLVSEH